MCITALIQILSLGQGHQVSDVCGDYRADGGREDSNAGGGRKGHGLGSTRTRDEILHKVEGMEIKFDGGYPRDKCMYAFLSREISPAVPSRPNARRPFNSGKFSTGKCL